MAVVTLVRVHVRMSHLQASTRRHVAQALNNGVLTCFAYGQTGSGKTYTMNSIIAYTVRDLFDHINNMMYRTPALRLSLIVSYYEVYMSKVGVFVCVHCRGVRSLAH